MISPTGARTALNTPQAIIVTGAAGGIGSAVLTTLMHRSAEHGHPTFFAADTAYPTAAGGGESRDVLHRHLDVSDPGSVDELFAEVAAGYDLRAVVHAAGVLATGPAVLTPPAAARELFSVNALGTILVASAAAATMLSQDRERWRDNTRSITTIASNAANGPRANFSVYGASKAAAASFTRSLGLEVGAAGIRCNVVDPGTTATRMVEAMWGGADRSREAVAGDPSLFRPGIPLGRIAQPQDIAESVDFLVSPRAAHVTLAQLSVDGGATQR
ncbi:MAG: SDR family oxidoreductase [Arthrobacter sp.]|jgi:2,3-dihydro-2,3-dihydroxybenzoate dehydrogenase|nr:SDR family oxidoreductase [Arthrobacter sp.]